MSGIDDQRVGSKTCFFPTQTTSLFLHTQPACAGAPALPASRRASISIIFTATRVLLWGYSTPEEEAAIPIPEVVVGDHVGRSHMLARIPLLD